MSIELDRIMETGSKVMDGAKKAVSELAVEGKRQADLLAARRKLAKTQRQLGALVYSLASSGSENPQLVKKYIASIASIEAEIADLQKPDEAGAAKQQEYSFVSEPETQPTACEHKHCESKVCPQCGSEVKEDALFCNRCGAQL